MSCTNDGALENNADYLAALLLAGSDNDTITNWQSFSMSIGATTTAPSKATTKVLDTGFYRRVGDSMELMYTYYHTNNAGATAGSGTYLFYIPTGTIDLTKVSTGSTGAQNLAIGIVGVGHVGGDPGLDASTALVVVFNSGAIAMVQERNATNDTTYVSDTVNPLNTAIMQYSINATIPIVGW